MNTVKDYTFTAACNDTVEHESLDFVSISVIVFRIQECVPIFPLYGNVTDTILIYCCVFLAMTMYDLVLWCV